MLKLAGLALILALVAWGSITFVRNEDNANALQSSAGFIESGSKFDVRVGDPVGAVDRAMRSHQFTRYERASIQTCLGHEYPPTQAVVVYADDTWRRGTACIAYERNSRRVESLEWAYGPFEVEL